jgi:hypothetical protein
VLERQALNDSGMSTLFKLNKISAAMELQDEKDRQNIFLMGSQIPPATAASTLLNESN